MCVRKYYRGSSLVRARAGVMVIRMLGSITSTQYATTTKEKAVYVRQGKV